MFLPIFQKSKSEASGDPTSEQTKPKHHQQVRVHTLRPRQNGRHFADDTFKRIFMNENIRIPINISLKFVPKGPINNIPALVQIMAWRRPGDKPLSEAMMVSLLTHICVTRPQWVNQLRPVMPYGTKPLPEPILTYLQRCFVAFLREQFHKNMN